MTGHNPGMLLLVSHPYSMFVIYMFSTMTIACSEDKRGKHSRIEANDTMNDTIGIRALEKLKYDNSVYSPVCHLGANANKGQ